MTILRYTPTYASLWDEFVTASRNGTFLMQRGYMDYHADRFADHSLLCYNEKQRVIGLLPANETKTEHGKVLYSHQGLTYGGWILSPRSKAEDVLLMFEYLKEYLQGNGFSGLYYKAIPTIYHQQPSEEDLYALFRIGVSVCACNLSSVIDLHSPIPHKTDASRRHRLHVATDQGFTLDMQAPLEEVWPIVEHNLQVTYGTRPVHNLEEMTRLKHRFDHHIKCVAVRDAEQRILGGGVLYLSGQVVHIQYGHATPEGKRQGAMDFMYLSLIDHFANHPSIRYFDFGTSNENQGKLLNTSLIAQKEGLGGRGIAYPTYYCAL